MTDDAMDHPPVAERLLAHLRDHYGIDAVAATRLSVHKTYVFRIDRSDGEPWVARAFPPARPRVGVDGDAAILRHLERYGYPAERLAVEPAVSDFEGSAVLVTRSFLDAVDSKVPADERERFEQLRDQVRSADDGHGLPESLLHGNLLHVPDHAILTAHGPVAINWKASGRGPRLSDLAYLIRGTGSWNPRRSNQKRIDAVVSAYRRHIEPTDEELNRLEAVMYIQTLYLVCFGYRRAISSSQIFNEWGIIEPPEYYTSTAAAARAAFRR